ncbi:MAG: ATP-NAD kinase family protein [Methanotrichaceae archaeon]|nr:ATP-NAD kinase family protein [Methanotrichaceae archaeon]
MSEPKSESKFRSKIGFLVNPIAGMGGAVGLKGTDGQAHEAKVRGARPLAPERAGACLRRLAPQAHSFLFLTASGEMGERVLRECGLDCSVVYEAPLQSSAEDTKAACKAFLEQGVDLILFCGGDGTARDVASVAGQVTDQVPVLGIPAGVKMHSGVFAISPEAAAELALGFLKGELKTRDTEVVDVDEELYRAGELQTKLYCTARTPYRPVLVQERKRIYASTDEEEFKDQIALFAWEFMRDGSAYILGAGTTTARIAEAMGLEKTLLGVDVVQNEKLIIKDASERDLLNLLDLLNKGLDNKKEKSAKIIVSPIGAQGFILGRGSQQISAEVLRRVGAENLIIVSTPHKLSELSHLLIYTGDPELDRSLAGRVLVVTGYRMAQRKDLKAASDFAAE